MVILNPTDDVIVSVEIPEIDALTAPEFESLVRGQLMERTDQPARFVLDLSAVRFMSSSGVAVLITARESVHRWGGDLVLRNVTRPVRRTIEVLGIVDRFTFD